MTQTKNKHAQALGRLKRGVKETPNAHKRAMALANLEAARLKRWPTKLQTVETVATEKAQHE